MADREYFPVTCWDCGEQVGWKIDYSYPMPSIYCERCKEKEERDDDR